MHGPVSEYSHSVSSYLISLDSPRKAPSKSSSLRNDTITALIQYSKYHSFSSETIQNAVSIIDSFLECTPTNPQILKLLALVCLFISSKHYETTRVSLNALLRECRGNYTRNNLIEIELFVLERLEWRVIYPTIAELSKSLLNSVAPELEKKDDIIEKVDILAFSYYETYNMTQFSLLDATVNCLSTVLEVSNLSNIRDELIWYISGSLHRIEQSSETRNSAPILTK